MKGQMHTVWCNESFLAWLPAQKLHAYVSVSHDGRLEPEVMPWVPAEERPYYRPTPSCGFFLTLVPADHGKWLVSKSRWQSTNVRPSPTMRESIIVAERGNGPSSHPPLRWYSGWLAWD